MGFLQGLFHTLSLFPFIPFLLVYFVVLQRNKIENKRWSWPWM